MSHDSRPAASAKCRGRLELVGGAPGRPHSQGWKLSVPPQAGMWVQVEMPTSVPPDRDPVHVIASGGGRAGAPSLWTAPRGYRVQVSADGNTWSAPVAEGRSRRQPPRITFAPVRAKFVRITPTAPCPTQLNGRCGC